VAAVSGAAEPLDDSNRFVLRYDAPAEKWETQALPIGNGRLGGMVFGGVPKERIQLNEDSLWTGDENASGNYGSMGAYQTLGDLFIELDGHDQFENYRRSLDIRRAIADVEYTSNGVRYRREYFSSFPHQVIVVRLTADKPGSHSGTIRLADAHGAEITAEKGRITAPGKLGNGLLYETMVVVEETGGSLTSKDGAIVFSDADNLTIVLAAGTDYLADYEKGWRREGGSRLVNARNIATQLLAAEQTYEWLREAHVKDHQALFNRVDLNTGETDAAVGSLPTDKRLAAYRGGAKDPELESLFFQYGRYLLIASSRPGCLPANLQGIWNGCNRCSAMQPVAMQVGGGWSVGDRGVGFLAGCGGLAAVTIGR